MLLVHHHHYHPYVFSSFQLKELIVETETVVVAEVAEVVVELVVVEDLVEIVIVNVDLDPFEEQIEVIVVEKVSLSF